MKSIKYIALTAVILCGQQSHGMFAFRWFLQPVQKRIAVLCTGLTAIAGVKIYTNDKYRRSIKGDLFIIPNPMQYPSNSEFPLKQALNAEIDSHDPLVQIWATSRDKKSEASYGTQIASTEGVWPEWIVAEVNKRAELEKDIGRRLTKEEIDAAMTPQEKEYWAAENQYWRNNREQAKKTGRSDNWARHGHPAFKETFPDALPYSILKDKKENDKLNLKVWGKEVELRCKQNGYRYGSHRFGLNFQEMLAELKQKFDKK